MNRKCIFKFLNSFFEYVLIILALIETNSLFLNSIDNNYYGVHEVTLYAASFLLFGMIICVLCENTDLIKQIKLFLPVLLVLFGLIVIFKVLCVSGEPQCTEYIIKFLCILPLLCLYFFLKRKEGMYTDFWIKFSNTVFCFAILNVLTYICVVIAPDVLTVNMLHTSWSGTPERYLCNYYNLCNVENGLGRYFFGMFFPRNMGIYPEPLMYVIPLIISLFTEMFLRNEGEERYVRGIVYTVAIVTSQSTLGILLGIFAWTLKGFTYLKHRIKLKKLLMLAIIPCMVCLYLFWKKYTQVPTSFSAHFEDYIYGIKAFLAKPVLGGGYENEEYIRSFMSESRRASNPGLSNSISIVLAEGGLLLGSISLIPFLVVFLQFFNKKNKENRRIALWTLGCFGLYCVTIFHFHMILLAMWAFGYSMIEVRYQKKGIQLSIWPEETVKENPGLKHVYSKKKIITAGVVVVGLFVVFLNVKAIWTTIYAIMQANQLLMGDHIWYWICFIVVLIFLIVYLKEKNIEPQKKGYLIVYTLFFLVVRSWLYSWIHTVLIWKSAFSDYREAVILTGLYFAGIIVLHMLCVVVRKMTKKTKLLCVAVVLIIVGVAGAFINRKLDQHEYVMRSEKEPLDKITAVNTGILYVDDLPVFYHHFYPQIRYVASSGEGFASKKNTTILMTEQTNIQELFDAGFEITRISDQHVIYTNNEEMISALKKEGYTFYHYYPYAFQVDLKAQAELNHLKQSKGGGCIIKGQSHSLIWGPYYWLDAGKYEVTYTLHVKNPEQDTPVCQILVNAEYGQQQLASQEINTNMADDRGNITVSMTFEIQQKNSVIEFLAHAYAEYKIEIKEINYRKKYEYVSTKQYNGRHLAEIIKYYSSEDDEVYNVDGNTYCAVKRKYDDYSRMVEERYLGTKMQPIATKEGYYFIRRQYDTNPNVETTFYYNEDGSNYVFSSGYSARRVTYLENNGYQIVYLDEKGEIVTLDCKFAEEKRINNERGQVLEHSYYDRKGNPVDPVWGYAKVVYEYDENGVLKKTTTYDAAGAVVEEKKETGGE